MKHTQIQPDDVDVLADNPILLDSVSHAYGQTRALDDVTLSIGGGELVALLGPSGCGKSTLLRIIAGFLSQSKGRVVVGDRVLDHVSPNRREIGIVFQNYALFPHMTAAENVAYGLAAVGAPRELRRRRVAEMLDVVQLAHLRDRRPAELSGGQQQRVALARALAVRPKVLLLDEPFAALDKNLRLDMQIEIKRLQRKFALTTILVTHDQDEAMSIADRIAVMNRGRVEQFDTPVEVYDRPRTPFVNGFIGSSNLLAGTVEGRDGPAYRVRLDAGVTWVAHGEAALPEGARAVLSVRPEQLSLHDTPSAGRLPVVVDLAMPIAGSVVHDLRCADGTEMKALGIRNGAAVFPVGARIHCAPASECRLRLFPEDTSNHGVM